MHLESMKCLLTWLFLINTVNVVAQNSSDSGTHPLFSKGCSWQGKLVYPEKAVENHISGQVLIQIDRDTDDTYHNPVVIKGLGYGCDESALRFVSQWIEGYNKCVVRYHDRVERAKMTQPVIFKCDSDTIPRSGSSPDSTSPSSSSTRPKAKTP